MVRMMNKFFPKIANYPNESSLFEFEKGLKLLCSKTEFFKNYSINDIRSSIKPLNIHFDSNYDFPSFISDDAFIVPLNDIAIHRHPRYLPAIPHYHSFFEIAYVIEGTAEHHIGKQVQQLSAGDLFILAPGTSHALSAMNDDALILNFLLRTTTFDKTFMAAIGSTNLLGIFFKNALYNQSERSYLEFKTGNNLRLKQLAEALYVEECIGGRYNVQAKNQLLSLFFTYLLRYHEKDIILPTTKEHTLYEDNIIFILKYMESHYNHITLQDLCDFFNYSQRHMIRLIQKHTNMTFSENIQLLKLKHAANLLIETSNTITHICEEIGYSNLNRFKNAFISCYGCTPQEYREKFRDQM